MTIYISRGAGLLGILLPPALVVPTGIILDAALGKAFLERHEWIGSLLIVIAGLVTSLIGYMLNRRDKDPEESMLKRLFWA